MTKGVMVASCWRLSIRGVAIAQQQNAGTFLPASKGGLGNGERGNAIMSMNYNHQNG